MKNRLYELMYKEFAWLREGVAIEKEYQKKYHAVYNKEYYAKNREEILRKLREKYNGKKKKKGSTSEQYNNVGDTKNDIM